MKKIVKSLLMIVLTIMVFIPFINVKAVGTQRSVAVGISEGGSYSADEIFAHDETGPTNAVFESEDGSITFTATPNVGYIFSGWYEGVMDNETHFVGSHTSTLYSSNTTFTTTISDSILIYALFEEENTNSGSTNTSRVQVIMSESANNNRGTYKMSGGGQDASVDHNSSMSPFIDIGTQITLTATPDEYNTFVGWYNAEEYNITGNPDNVMMGWRTKGNALSTNSSYTFTVSEAYYNLMPVFESRAGHNNIWITGDGEIAVLYENRDANEQSSLDGEHWATNGIVVDYMKGDNITIKARAKEGSHFVGWYITDPAASVPANYVRTPVVSTSANYTYQPGITTISGYDEPLNYLTAVFEEDNTNELTIVSGANQTYYKGSNTTITIVASGEFSKLIGIEIDNGNPMREEDMILEEGSTKLTLKTSFLENSSLGEHTITFVYDELGEVETKLTISNEEPATPDEAVNTNNPQTGDKIIMYVSMLVLSILGIVSSGLYLRKCKMN